MQCPCCSGKVYSECCQLYHLGALPPSPLALMRSRYSAYALKNCDYIIQTTHPKSIYFEKDRKAWKQAIEQFSEETRFLKLEILEAEGDQVTFIAHLEQKGKPVLLKEKSHFQKVDGKWLYLSGEIDIS